jgi:hypothetical protein
VDSDLCGAPLPTLARLAPPDAPWAVEYRAAAVSLAEFARSLHRDWLALAPLERPAAMLSRIHLLLSRCGPEKLAVMATRDLLRQSARQGWHPPMAVGCGRFSQLLEALEDRGCGHYTSEAWRLVRYLGDQLAFSPEPAGWPLDCWEIVESCVAEAVATLSLATPRAAAGRY